MIKVIKNTIILIFFVGALGYFGYFFYQSSLNPCEKSIGYSLGRFDTQFGVSKEEFKNYINQAEQVWEKAIGRDIFIYDPDASLKINLIYDQRQLTTIQKQRTEFGLSAVEEVFKELDNKFNLFKAQYDGAVSSYEEALTRFKQRQSAYDAEVSFWNKKGGAPKEKYDSLNAERQYLNTEAQRLNAQTIYINDMANQLNILLKERNIKAAQYNSVAESYNKKYGGGLEFNQAEYLRDGRKGQINVYQFGNKEDLILALTHEFGHALGMDHTENPKSIMYYLTGANTETTLAPTTEDLAELKRVCK